MYAKTNRFVLFFLILGVSLVLAEPRRITHNNDAKGRAELHDELIHLRASEVKIIQELNSGSLLMLKAKIKGRKLVHGLQRKSAHLKSTKIVLAFKDALTALNHEYEARNGKPLYVTDSKPKSAHSCQNSFV